MFSFKRSPNESNPTNINSGTALPNNYGHIRTMKEDLEDFKSGKKEDLEEPEKTAVPTLNPPSPQPFQPERQMAPARPALEQSLPSVPANPPQQEKKEVESKSAVPSPFGSETFFETRSPFDEKVETPKAGTEAIAQKPKSHLLVVIFSIALLLLIGGGGIYYWWFFLKQSGRETSQPTQKTITPSENEQPAASKPDETPGPKQWNLDLEADKISNKLAVERYAKNLMTSALESKAVEIKILSKDNQPISPQKLEEIFDFQLPVSVSDKLTEDYSLFLTKENGEPRMGAAFKLNQALGLAESLKSEETTIFANLKSFYLDKAPADNNTIFNSSTYKSADIRYFNFPSPPNTSLDYTVLSNKQNSYFLFSISKNSIRAILDYMSEK